MGASEWKEKLFRLPGRLDRVPGHLHVVGARVHAVWRDRGTWHWAAAFPGGARTGTANNRRSAIVAAAFAS